MPRSHARLPYPALAGLALLAGLVLRLPSAVAGNLAHLAILNCLWPQPTVALACQVSGTPAFAGAWQQIEASPDQAERARFLGYAAEWSDLRADFEQTSEAATSPLYLHWAGMAYYKLGDTEAAVETWRRAPETAMYWTRVCVVGINAQQWSEARQACELALRIAPEHGRAHAELGRVQLYGEGDVRGALAAFSTAEALGGNNASTWLAWAHALDQAGQPAQAAQLLDAHSIAGPLADAIRANALRAAGQLAEAVLLYQRALAQDDRDPWIWNALAMTYLEMGDRAAARAAWETALTLRPDFQPAHEGLNQLVD